MASLYRATLAVQRQQDATILAFPTIGWISDEDENDDEDDCEDPDLYPTSIASAAVCCRTSRSAKQGTPLAEKVSDISSDCSSLSSNSNSSGSTLLSSRKKARIAAASMPPRMVVSRKFHSKLWMLGVPLSPASGGVVGSGGASRMTVPGGGTFPHQLVAKLA